MRNASGPPKVLRVSDVGERLGVSRATVWRWEEAGILPKRLRLGPNVVGWLEAEINEFIATRVRGDTPGAALKAGKD